MLTKIIINYNALKIVNMIKNSIEAVIDCIRWIKSFISTHLLIFKKKLVKLCFSLHFLPLNPDLRSQMNPDPHHCAEDDIIVRSQSLTHEESCPACYGSNLCNEIDAGKVAFDCTQDLFVNICPRRSYPFYIVTYHKKWVTTC